MIDLEGDELTHWGIKGQKWGERKYQYKDGSLTPAGRKRYGDAPDFVKKNKVSRKVQKQRAKNLEKARQAKAEKKKAEEEAKRKEEEALKKKEQLLKSVDAKELYKNKDLLTNQEIQDRLTRIDLENRLNSKIEPTKTGMEKATEYLDKTTKLVTAGSNLYKSVDGVVSMVTGKNIGKHLGLDKLGEEKLKDFDPDDFVKNMHKLSDDEFNKKYGRYTKVNLVKKAEADKAQKIKEAEEAQKIKEAEEAAAKAAKEAAERLDKADASAKSRATESAKKYVDKVIAERADKERKAIDDNLASYEKDRKEREQAKRDADVKLRAEEAARRMAERLYNEHQNKTLIESSDSIDTGRSVVDGYLEDSRSNNWLKLHGYPMRRGRK